ncbi:hypothetical protein GCM10010518_51010 [Kitasatospora cinereorecta]
MYFGDHGLGGHVLVLALWFVAGPAAVGVAGLTGARGRRVAAERGRAAAVPPAEAGPYRRGTPASARAGAAPGAAGADDEMGEAVGV